MSGRRPAAAIGVGSRACGLLAAALLVGTGGIALPGDRNDVARSPRVSGTDSWEPSSVRAGFMVSVGGVTSRLRVLTVTPLPGERVDVAVTDGGWVGPYRATSAHGDLVARRAGRWTWTAPANPGLYRVFVFGAEGDSVTINVFVGVPTSRLRGERLNGYRVGRYPSRPLRGLAIYEHPPAFIEVTPQLLDVAVSPRFRLRQFVCKQAGGFPKYLVLDPRLLLKLEYVLDVVNAAGYPVRTLSVLSGYRTPFYNRAIGNVPYSRHVWGAAADMYVDENGDGLMDDLNGDGRIDVGDAETLYRLVDRQVGRREYDGFIGGVGLYPPNARHGPFVHVDLRDRRARW